jgi:5'-methylthioadenosine phosphorylase
MAKPQRLTVALIGGTGFEKFPFEIPHKTVRIKTAAGNVSMRRGEYRGSQIYFMLRHGDKHVAPHEVNYRANALALHHIGAQAILTSAAVGSLQPHHTPGDFLLLDDFIDLTRSRPLTVLNIPLETKGHRAAALHADMTEPYCGVLSRKILAAARAREIKMKEKAIYVCPEGPRFETRAEIAAYAKWGGDVIGMTQVPEVVFAKELGLCYAAVAVVTNMATGLSTQKISAGEVIDIMKDKAPLLRGVYQDVIDWLVENPRALLDPHH